MLARSKFCAAFFVCLLSVASANAATIILMNATTNNGSFNSGATGWTVSGAAIPGAAGNPSPGAQLAGVGSFFQTAAGLNVPTTATLLNIQWDEGGASGGGFTITLGAQNLAGVQGTAPGQPFTTVGPISVAPTVSGSQLLRFQSTGGGNPSSFIDNIVLTAIVPSLQLTPTGDPGQDVTVTNSPTNTTGTVSFGNVIVGTSRNRSVEVQNVLTGSVNDIRFNGATGPFGPGGSNTTNNVAIGGQLAQNYSFTPTMRNPVAVTQNITIVDDGDRNGTIGQVTDDTVTVELSGRGVAPVASVGTVSNTTNANFADSSGRVRIGNSSTFSLTITNTGDGNQSYLGAGFGNLDGSYTSAQPAGWMVGSGTAGAINLGDSGSQVLSYTFTPTTFGASNRSVGLDFTNGGGNDNSATSADTTVTLNASGVGPSLVATYAAATGAGTSTNPANGAPTALPTTNANNINFSQIMVGQQTSVVLTLSNDSPSADLGNLTDLTTSITNALAGTPFSISSTVGDALIENTADTLQLTLTFAPTSSGVFNGFFTLNTDQNAAFGGDGTDFRFNLSGSALAVPEPVAIAIWSVLGVAAVGYVVRRKRK